MKNKILLFIKKVREIFSKNTLDKLNTDVQVSSIMSSAIDNWFNIFYSKPYWIGSEKNQCKYQTKFAATVTNQLAILASNEIIINTGKGAHSDFVKEQIEKTVLPNMQSNIQLAAVGGSLVLKPYVHDGRIYCDTIPANHFYPTRFVGSTIEACFFADFDEVEDKEVVRIETHDLTEKGVTITNTAFWLKSGAPLELTVVERWKDLPPIAEIQNIKTPLYSVLRMPFPNTIDSTSKLPVSMFANSLETLEQIDKIYSEFLWEIKTGKRRQIFDISAVDMPNDGKKGKENLLKQGFAADQYILLDTAEVQKPFDDYTPEMRIEAYQKALDMQLRLLETQCGFSSGTFSFDIQTGTAKTATEVISQDKTTYNTVKAVQDRGLKEALEQLVEVYSIYAQLYKLAPKGKVEASISFGDSIFEDVEKEYTRRMNMVGSGMLKAEEVVAWYFGVSIEEAKAMMPSVDDITQTE